MTLRRRRRSRDSQQPQTRNTTHKKIRAWMMEAFRLLSRAPQSPTHPPTHSILSGEPSQAPPPPPLPLSFNYGTTSKPHPTVYVHHPPPVLRPTFNIQDPCLDEGKTGSAAARGRAAAGDFSRGHGPFVFSTTHQSGRYPPSFTTLILPPSFCACGGECRSGLRKPAKRLPLHNYTNLYRYIFTVWCVLLSRCQAIRRPFAILRVWKKKKLFV